MKYLLTTLIILPLFIGCQNLKKEEIKVLEKTVNTTPNDSINWINEIVGFDKIFTLKDTTLRADDKTFAYGSNLVLPRLVSKSFEYKTLNDKILTDFQPIIDKVKTNPKPSKDEYQKVDFTYYLNDSIITIRIENLHTYHLAEAATQYYIYHFDYKNNKLVSTSEMFTVLGLSRVPILSAFAEQCTFPPDYTEPLFDTVWFDKVKWKDLNLLKFYQNYKKQIVIIYPVAENGWEDEQILE